MNTNTITTLTLAGMLVALSACEGEPPKLPTNPPSAPAPEAAAPSATELASGTPGASVSGGSAGVSTTGACDCPNSACGAHAAMPVPPSSTPSTSEPSSDPAAVAVVSSPARDTSLASGAVAHEITGTVTAVPARAAATAVVYLEDAGIVPKRGSIAGIDNHGMSFNPYVTVVTTGGRVVFSNSDPFPHNVFSPDNERFNLGTVQMKGSTAHTFKTPGVYSLLCNLHPNMLGYVVVSPSSYFAKANAKGQFIIKDVPPGTYKITAWAPRLATITQSIAVKDADVTADFALHR